MQKHATVPPLRHPFPAHIVNTVVPFDEQGPVMGKLHLHCSLPDEPENIAGKGDIPGVCLRGDPAVVEQNQRGLEMVIQGIRDKHGTDR